MSEIKFDYGIESDLPARPESPAALGPKFLDTLDTLSRIDPKIFTNWTIPVIPDLEWLMDEVERSGVAAAIAKTETYSLEAARPRIAAIVEKNVARDDFRQPSLTYGYSLVANAGPAGEPRHMRLWIKAGGCVSGSMWLQAGDYKVLPDPALVTYPLFKAALLAINAIWPGTYAYAYANRTDYEKTPLFEPLPFFGFHHGSAICRLRSQPGWHPRLRFSPNERPMAGSS